MKKYGFNFLWMFSKGEHNPAPGEANLKELEFIANEGFNFVRIPMDYRFWTKDFDYLNPDERVMEKIDEYIEICGSFGLHVCLNIHRAPGYCINSPHLEKHNLWRDEPAKKGFCHLWTSWAERYKGISNERLSFDLVNEPSSQPPTHPCTRDDHEALIRRTIAEIRDVDPSRMIVIDGFDGGGTALPELADAGVIHSGRGYYPFQVSHYKAEWVKGAENWALPEYPGQVAPGEHADKDSIRRYYAPWLEVESKGVEVHIGEFGCYNKIPNQTALNWFEDLIGLFHEFAWGYSLWNFKGTFGVAQHGRPGTVYEDYKGMKIDRALLDILKSGMK